MGDDRIQIYSCGLTLTSRFDASRNREWYSLTRAGSFRYRGTRRRSGVPSFHDGRIAYTCDRESPEPLIVAKAIALNLLAVASARSQVVTDPDVRALTRSGRVRVLVVLHLGPPDDPQREDAIALAQDRVLSSLPPAHASPLRRLTSIPMLALEIDATALGILESLTDVVASIQLDRPSRPQ